MKWRMMFGITIGIILAAGVFGVVKKQTYTNVTSEKNYLDMVQVALLPEQMAENACKMLEESVPKAPIVLKGKAIGEREFLFHQGRQKIKITQICKGEELQKGDEIYLYSEHWRLNLYDEPHTVECGFVNIMKEDKEYLVFLSGQVEDYDTTIPVYKFYEEDLMITPMFCYDEMEEKIPEFDEECTYISYKEVKDNEFFGTSEASYAVWEQLKQTLFAKYQ